jgi:hypothetical protein
LDGSLHLPGFLKCIAQQLGKLLAVGYFRESVQLALPADGHISLGVVVQADVDTANYPDEFPPNMFGDAVAWLRENEVDNAAAVERGRWSRILSWTTIVVVAVGVAGMLAAWTAAWPLAKEWIRLRAG